MQGLKLKIGIFLCLNINSLCEWYRKPNKEIHIHVIFKLRNYHKCNRVLLVKLLNR